MILKQCVRFWILRCLQKHLDQMIESIMSKLKRKHITPKWPPKRFRQNFLLSRGKMWLSLFYSNLFVRVFKIYTGLRIRFKAWGWFFIRSVLCQLLFDSTSPLFFFKIYQFEERLLLSERENTVGLFPKFIRWRTQTYWWLSVFLGWGTINFVPRDILSVWGLMPTIHNNFIYIKKSSTRCWFCWYWQCRCILDEYGFPFISYLLALYLYSFPLSLSFYIILIFCYKNFL